MTSEQANTMSTKKTKKRGATKAKPITAKARANTAKAASKPTTRAEADAAPKHGKTRKPAADKPKRVSALDAAATVLKKTGTPMRAQQLINAMAAQALWKSPGGKTPHPTLYAAILREITAKGKGARFRKVERGQFEFAG
ncbi:MAG: hypothetical protein DCC65_17490 [Planctomycetota bacterium]|nr:MAG: hypothetical protein DCC65_17490 [Planctomycetota bacterium]